jgi:Fe-S cluster assembly ATPase SufC
MSKISNVITMLELLQSGRKYSIKELSQQLEVTERMIRVYKEENPDTSILIITHHPKILEYLKPDKVHVINNGTITKSGNYDLATIIEKNGYNDYKISENNITNEANYE